MSQMKSMAGLSKAIKETIIPSDVAVIQKLLSSLTAATTALNALPAEYARAYSQVQLLRYDENNYPQDVTDTNSLTIPDSVIERYKQSWGNIKSNIESLRNQLEKYKVTKVITAESASVRRQSEGMVAYCTTSFSVTEHQGVHLSNLAVDCPDHPNAHDMLGVIEEVINRSIIDFPADLRSPQLWQTAVIIFNQTTTPFVFVDTVTNKVYPAVVNLKYTRPQESSTPGLRYAVRMGPLYAESQELLENNWYDREVIHNSLNYSVVFKRVDVTEDVYYPLSNANADFKSHTIYNTVTITEGVSADEVAIIGDNVSMSIDLTKLDQALQKL